MTTYPIAPRVDAVDSYHGTPVADPYRWLEAPDAPETQAFVAAQNALSQTLLGNLPQRDAFHRRLTDLWDFTRYGAPQERNGRFFFNRNDGLQNQAVLYTSTDLAEDGVVLLDPNEFSEDGTVALTTLSPSDDGRYLAYGSSASGSDWQVIRVRDVATGEDLPDRIEWCKFTNIVWQPDCSGFYYARYPSPADLESGPLAGEPVSTHHRIYFHTLGTPQTADALIYARPDARDLAFDIQLSHDERYLVLNVWQGTDTKTRLYYKDLHSEDEFVRLLDEQDAGYDYLGNDGPLFYVATNKDAPNGRVIAIDIRRPEPDAWREIVPEQAHALDYGYMAGEQFVLLRLVDASHRLELYERDGRPAGEVPLPGLGQVIELQARRQSPVIYLTFTSFLYPPTVLSHDTQDGRTEIIRQPELPFDLGQFETTQVFATSGDGTRLPIFLTSRKDAPRDAPRPTLLYGYGGFNVNVLPAFSPVRLLWLEQGGLFASATLRGGGEYGEAWHEAGMLGNKQTVFDDFIAAAEWLIANDYTTSDHLAIEGRSNGGLLTAACLLQRPDLYGAVHSAVPVIDMLRYQRFTAGRYWTPEYGDAEADPDHFAFLKAYSPLHNVRPGVSYPPLLLTTADTDDRVVPMHALKFAATLQAAAEYELDPERPLLVRVETRAGHGLGKPTSKLIDEAADVVAFLWHFVGP